MHANNNKWNKKIRAALISGVLMALAMVFCLGLGGIGWKIPAGIFKMAASCGFLAVAYFAGAFETRFGMAIFAGLVASWFGDLFLIFPKTFFLAGLIAFFIGHMAYAAACLIFGVKPAWSLGAAAMMLGPLLGIAYWLQPHLPVEMRIPVYAYMAVITTMVALAAGAVGKGAPKLLLLGAVLFYVSDICVARQAFVEQSALNPLIGLPLYFGGQALIAFAVKGANEANTQKKLVEPL